MGDTNHRHAYTVGSPSRQTPKLQTKNQVLDAEHPADQRMLPRVQRRQHQLVHQQLPTTMDILDLIPRMGPSMDNLQVVAACCR